MTEIAKILELLERSIKVVLAVALAGPIGIALFPAASTFFAVPTVFAWGFLFIQLVVWSWRCVAGAVRWTKVRWHRWNIFSRTDSLVPRTRLALLWISNNPDETIYGSPFDDPYRELLTHGFIFKTDMTTQRAQAYKVHSRVYSSGAKDRIGARLPEHVRSAVATGMQRPW